MSRVPTHQTCELSFCNQRRKLGDTLCGVHRRQEDEQQEVQEEFDGLLEQIDAATNGVELKAALRAVLEYVGPRH